MICREAGYPQGALKPFIGSHFGHGVGHLLLDELDCSMGNVTSLLDCHFDPWNTTDCNDKEWAGVSCKPDGPVPECDPSGVMFVHFTKRM